MSIDIINLEKALKAGAYDGSPRVPTLKIEKIDIGPWTEFWDFFEKPESRSTIFQTPSVDDKPGLLLPCVFLSVVSTSKEKAIKRLRNDLYKLMSPKVSVVAFLAKPSVIELVSPLRSGEVADAEMFVDLRGPVPAKKRFAAFCFLHGYRDGSQPASLDMKFLRELGVETAVSEGEVGPDVDLEDDEVQEQLYPLPSRPPGQENLLLKPDSKTELVITGVQDPVETIAAMHPEIAEAAAKHGIDLKQPPGRELEQMRKFFGQGTGLYLVTVDFQIARTEAFKLDERAQKRILKALNPPKRKRNVKRIVKPKKIVKRIVKKPVRKKR